MAKYTFDSRSLSTENSRHERQPRSFAPSSGGEPRAKAPSWAKASVLRMLVVTCSLGFLLYMFFGNALLGYIGNWMIAALFIPLVGELFAGLMHKNRVRRVSDERAVAASNRTYGRFAWCMHLLLLLCFATAVGLSWHGRGSKEAATHVAPPSSDDVPDGGRHVHDTVVKVSAEQVKAYLTPSEAEVEHLYRMVVTAPFVAENFQYRERLKDIPFVYIATNDIVNAASGRRVVEKDGEKCLAFHTVFFGGAARYARLVGLAAALQDAGHKDMLKKFVAAMPRRFCGICDEKSCEKFIVANGLGEALSDEKIRLRAISYSSGTIISVLAHECGHHALGHLLGFPDKQNLEIDKNQEREADSFASSVISASPFGEFIFAGTLFWHYAVAMQSDGDSDAERDHPLSRERFENFVRSNRDKAAAMGITLDK